MKKGLWWRIALTAFVFLIATAYLIPGIVFYSAPGASDTGSNAFIEKYLPKGRINLGLDLKGGIHLTLGVEVEKALSTRLAQIGQSIASEANKKGLLMTKPRLLHNDQLEFIFMLAEKKADLEELFAKEYADLAISGPFPEGGNLRYTAMYKSEAKKRIEGEALDQALSTIRNRIDQFGVAEPDVRKQEGNRISIQLPGMDSTQRAVAVIGKTAHLEFRFVREDVFPGSIPPAGVEFLPMASSNGGADRLLAVESKGLLTGEYITNAQPRPNPNIPGSYIVSISFDRRGADLFSQLTGDNIGRRLAIVLDGKIHSAPVIEAKIYGDAQITGNFTTAEAVDLSVVLRAGSLPAPVTVLEERTVGPSLGQESIDMGVTAALIASAVLFIFMAVYYGWSGIIADVMLILDVILILAGMALFGATLTLPGIAGIVLTLSTAIDANVLIFERIREELKKGQPVMDAVSLGFSHAQRAIIDSNLTSVIATVILYELGSGPIRGFAVTLTLGIIASMFTAVFVSHIVFNIWISKPDRKLSI